MKLGKFIFAITIAMVLSITTLTIMINDPQDQGDTTMITTNYHHHDHQQENVNSSLNSPRVSERISRFLATRNPNPRASSRCRRNPRVCTTGGLNETCCRNRCVDLSYDDDNCGACGERCLYTETCCRGECVNLAYDPRHCGECNFRCRGDEICFYGMCNYG